jgi:Pentapeptide repeats (8 copies)
LIIALLAVIVMVYLFNVNVPGLRGKTLWDWLQLLIVPLALAFVALLFNLSATRTEQNIATHRYEQDQQLAMDKQREDLLQTYLDRMSELLLDKQLRASKPDTEVRNIVRARTITILFQLDARRIGYVFAFLRESGLISNEPNKSIVSFSQADLRKINFSQADLHGAVFVNANFREANLCGADLREADLREAIFTPDTNNVLDIRKDILRGEPFGDAILDGADLRDADQTDTVITVEQLESVNQLKGATRHGGSIHP